MPDRGGGRLAVHEAVTRYCWPEIGAEAVSGTFSKELITYLECRQSRVLNAMDNLVNVVVGAVVDASVYTFAAQTVIVVFARLDVIFNENLFHLALFFNKTIRTRFMSICPGHGDRQLDVESLLKG